MDLVFQFFQPVDKMFILKIFKASFKMAFEQHTAKIDC